MVLCGSYMGPVWVLRAQCKVLVQHEQTDILPTDTDILIQVKGTTAPLARVM